MPRHKKGTLVRVKPEALESTHVYSELNTEHVKAHGYLWIVERWNVYSEYYMCKSLATGVTGVAWKAVEITTRSRRDA